MNLILKKSINFIVLIIAVLSFSACGISIFDSSEIQEGDYKDLPLLKQIILAEDFYTGAHNILGEKKKRLNSALNIYKSLLTGNNLTELKHKDNKALFKRAVVGSVRTTIEVSLGDNSAKLVKDLTIAFFAFNPINFHFGNIGSDIHKFVGPITKTIENEILNNGLYLVPFIDRDEGDFVNITIYNALLLVIKTINLTSNSLSTIPAIRDIAETLTELNKFYAEEEAAGTASTVTSIAALTSRANALQTKLNAINSIRSSLLNKVKGIKNNSDRMLRETSKATNSITTSFNSITERFIKAIDALLKQLDAIDKAVNNASSPFKRFATPTP